MNAQHCRLRKSAEQRNDLNIKLMSTLLAGKVFLGSFTNDNKFINVKNAGDAWLVFAGLFVIFLFVENLFRSNFSNQKDGLQFFVHSDLNSEFIFLLFHGYFGHCFASLTSTIHWLSVYELK